MKQTSFSGILRQHHRHADPIELRSLTPALGQADPYDCSSSNSQKLASEEASLADADGTGACPRKRRHYLKGWRFGALSCATSVSVVFLVNLIVTIWGAQSNNGGQDHSILLESDCNKIARINSGLHLLINALSTILLSASNYCMHCLSAPTRGEIDRAHAKGIWLDIGVPSVRNLRHISKRRMLLWVLIGSSSLPLHLFYNSAVFSSITSNRYWSFSVSQSFVDNPECLNCGSFDENFGFEPPHTISDILQKLHMDAHHGTLERLENLDCINQYAQMIQSDRRNVLLVASDANFPAPNENRWSNNTQVYDGSYFDGSKAADPSGSDEQISWICSGLDAGGGPCQNYLEEVKSHASSWHVYGYPVQYCLSEKAQPHCRLHFSLPIAVTVTILNAFKIIMMFYTALLINEDPIMNMGDAVASFMEREDPITRFMCLVTLKDMKKQNHQYSTLPRQWMETRYRWKDVTSRKRRITIFMLFSVALVLVIFLLNLGVKALPSSQSHSLAALARLGYGAVDPRTIIIWGVEGTIGNILIANLAQPILSLLYFAYNGLFTCMLLGYEWASYAHHRKALRVSTASRGKQRSTYFLQLPYRFALPLMVLSGVLHWLVSQSIFLVAIDFWDANGQRMRSTTSDPNNLMSCGYSPIAIVSVLILGILMLIGVFAFGYVPYRPGINLAGSCSWAISAACHNKEWDAVGGYEAAGEKVKWGVVEKNADAIGHCAFSAREVEFPKDGGLYAGYTQLSEK